MTASSAGRGDIRRAIALPRWVSLLSGSLSGRFSSRIDGRERRKAAERWEKREVAGLRLALGKGREKGTGREAMLCRHLLSVSIQRFSVAVAAPFELRFIYSRKTTPIKTY